MNVAVFTDLETDDVLALLMIVHRCRLTSDCVRVMMVVGEADAELKARTVGMALKRALEADFGSCVGVDVLYGAGSDKEYPIGDFAAASSPVDRFTHEALVNFAPSTVYIMKPPREYISAAAEAGEAAAAVQQAVGADVVMYASFNMRQVQPAGAASAAALHPLRAALMPAA